MAVIPNELIERWVERGSPRIYKHMSLITGMIIDCRDEEDRVIIISGRKRIRNQEG